MVRRGVSAIPKTRLKAIDKRGVASEKVVAVPANRAKTAVRSISLPMTPSTFFPRRGRQASEYFCLFLLRTWIMKPKETARIM